MADNLKPKVKKYIDNLSASDQDGIYRYLWHQRVVADVESHADDLDIKMKPKDVDFAAYLFVYEGDYDCNQSYWDNIENVIKRAIDD